MAIIIPSKHIYDKNNPKVRNNVVKKIEINSQKVEGTNEIDVNVYTETLTIGSKLSAETIKSEKTFYYSGFTYWAIALFDNQKVSHLKVKVPILGKNKYISKINTGLNKESEETYIQIRRIGYVYKGVAENIDVRIGDNNQITSFTWENNFITKSELSTINIPSEIVSLLDDGSTIGTEISAKLSFEDFGNLQTVTPKIEDDFYVFDLIIHCDTDVVLLKSNEKNDPYYTPVGTVERYETVSIEISFNGNIIGIDLADNNIIVGEANSKKLTSFDGGELLQTSNYLKSDNSLAIEQEFSKTIAQYSNGKETATILCSISDYFDEYGYKIISPNKSRNILNYLKNYYRIENNGVSFYLNVTGEIITNGTATDVARYSLATKAGIFLYTPKTLYLSGCPSGGSFDTYRIEITYKDKNQEEHSASDLGNGVLIQNVSSVISVDIIIGYNFYASALRFYPMLTIGSQVKDYEKPRPMTFNIYDEVIPMVLSANGNDRPMSLYSDGTPKKFKVLGVRTYYDGVTMQEISIQEVTKDENV